MGLLKKLFMSADERTVNKLFQIADQIDAMEPAIQALSHEQLKAKTAEFKDRLQNGETLDDIMVEAFAVIREAANITIGQRPYREQIIGAIVLHQGRIAELKTGEGKTLMSTLAGYLNALTGEGVHLVTVNDYLARHQSAWMGKIYTFLGLTVGVAVAGMSPDEKRAAYQADITYGTNNEFGFDYLRDNMVIHKHNMVQRPLAYAMIDEVDSILIDEARTPLIISGQGEKSTDLYAKANTFVKRLKEKPPVPEDEEVDENDPKYSGDYVRDEKLHTVNLSDEGVARAEQYFNVDNLGDIENSELSHHVNQALKANYMMHRDKDYIVKDGEVVIVDEFTGRLMVGRRYSDGLHQAIEAKESVHIRNESKTLATITFQNYFRMYKKLSGMTATAKTEENEFRGIYGMDVVVIPTHKPMIREDENDTIYRSVKAKFDAVVEDVVQCNEKGQPVLVGTVSVEKSEHLSKLLKRRGVKHTVLNAKYHEKEAEIVAQAGRVGTVTIATNMAGRGTDIKLGGDPEMMARRDLINEGVEISMLEIATSHIETEDPETLELRQRYNDIHQKYKVDTDREHVEVVELGGLRVVGTERHESRRIDNQLRGRSGRQGDPGSSKFYIALEDDLMRLFGGERIEAMMGSMNLEENVPLEYGILSRQIENAQKKVEGRNFNTRKHVLQYDDVMNKQREIIYKQRRQVLNGENIKQSMLDMLKSLVDDAVSAYAAVSDHPEEWDMHGLLDYFHHIFLPKGHLTFTKDEVEALNVAKLQNILYDTALELYETKEKHVAENGLDMREVERVILLRVVDRKWMDHIDAMDQLRQGVGLRAYGQRDPVVEYRMEGFQMFETMTQSIREEAVGMIYKMSVQAPPKRKAVENVMTGRQRAAREKVKKGNSNVKVGRNDPCPCGSGKKYKQCCGRA